MEKLNKTVLYEEHQKRGAKIVDFAGWLMPLEYTSSLEEAKAVRSKSGLFDVSHMGQIKIRGRRGKDFLQKLISNDIERVSPGKMQYNLFLNPEGGIIDDFMLYPGREGYICVVNASNKDKVLGWLNLHKTSGVEIEDISLKVALISVQGPDSPEIVSSVFKGAEDLTYLSFLEKESSGLFMISRSGYTGEDGFEIYLPVQNSLSLWSKFMEAGKALGIRPCGLGSRDILRIEAGYPLYGHEIGEDINPYRAGLGWAVKMDKDFIGKDSLLKIKARGPEYRRIGFIMEEKGFPRQGYSLYFQDKPAGIVCSGAYSPNLDCFLGMGYLRSGIDAEYINVEIRGRFLKARVMPLPFVKIMTVNSKVLS